MLTVECFLLQDFAINLENKVSSINEALQMKALTFVIDACKVLAQARKVSGSLSSSDTGLWGMQTVTCPLSSGAGLLLRLQLLQPGDGEDGCDGAADRGSGPTHQRPADPAG